MRLRPNRIVFLALLAALLFSPAARALPPDADAWLRLETPDFTLFSNAGETPTRRLATDLQRLRAALVGLDPDIKLSAPSPTFLYLFRDGHSLSPYRLIYQGKPMDVGGYFLARPEANYVAINADPRGDARAIVYHEYLHYVLRNNYPGLPLWLHEGLAELYSTFEADGTGARIGLPVGEHLRWLQRNPPLPLAELFAVDAKSKDYNEGMRRGVFYAQSWALAHYLLVGTDARREPVLRYLRTFAQGKPSGEAFQAAFGGELERELRAYVSHKVFRYDQIPAEATPQMDVRTSPLSRADLLAGLGMLLSFLDRSRWTEAEEHLKAALAAQPDHAPALAGLGVLADLSGRRDEAGSWLEKAARAAPGDFLIQYRYGTNRLALAPDAAALRQAREALSRAVALRPDYADAWARLGYALSFEMPLPPDALKAYETAHRLMPSSPEIAYNLMLARLRSGQAREAEELIDRVILAEGGATEAERARAVWVEEVRGDVERRIEEGDLDGAVPLLEELVAKAPVGEPRASLERRLAEVREAAAYNRFGERYQEAVRLADEGKLDEAVRILEDLAANAPTPGQAAEARRMLDRIRSMRSQGLARNLLIETGVRTDTGPQKGE